MTIKPGLYEMKTNLGLYRVTSIENGMVNFTSLNGVEQYTKSEEQFAAEYAEYSEPESETVEMVEAEPDAGEVVEVETKEESEA